MLMFVCMLVSKERECVKGKGGGCGGGNLFDEGDDTQPVTPRNLPTAVLRGCTHRMHDDS